MKTVKFNEWVEHLNGLSANDIPPYPMGGSTGVYTVRLTEKLLLLTGNEIKLFMILLSGTNEYNQVPYSREECATAMGVKYNRGNIGKYMSKLIEVELIALFESIPTVNPYIALPSVKTPKVKATLQRAWQEMVEFT